jgi:hypothetical protein
MKIKRKAMNSLGPPRKGTCPVKKVVPFTKGNAQRMRDDVLARMQSMKACTIYFGGDPD